MAVLNLPFGLTFQDLYTTTGLTQVDAAFCTHLQAANPALAHQFLAARTQPDTLEPKFESELLITLGPYVEDFIGILFGINSELQGLATQHHALAPLFTIKRQFVQRRAAKFMPPIEAAQLNGNQLTAQIEPLISLSLDASRKSELAFAQKVATWLADEEAHAFELDLALHYAAWALHSLEGQARYQNGLLFHLPHKIDPHHLVPLETEVREGVTMLRLPLTQHRLRDGFNLTDPGTDLAGALDQANYCIWCHHQGKDSCSKGMKDRTTGQFQKNAQSVTLTGCPLEQKISEMHELKAQGVPLGALAMIMVDNPLCAATGHRICNDCMKACIYQKQEPVDIPQAETRILRDILDLPWGFEVYSLLTRWNPLNLRRPLPRPDSGYKVLVAGLGPAGFTLAHHLLNEGHTVVGIDGLKIEPLIFPEGEKIYPIHNISTLYENLSERTMAGFGGVAEYGITVRWDKNFLKIIRLLLERRQQFSLFGGARLGGTITLDQAFEMGFDHIALCMGAGKPTLVPMKNGLARGVRQASDFLMALQLTGAAKANSIANLELQMPIVVIGGGLTAIDTATEALAYYPVQVEKFLSRYEALIAEQGEEAVRKSWSEEERLTAETFLTHAHLIRTERSAAAKENRPPRLNQLLDSWGGATIVYRRTLVQSPSYTFNHEEVKHGFEEGIRFVENATPVAVEVDRFGHAKGLRFSSLEEEIILPARCILIAAGTQPNTVLARETAGLELDGKYFQALDERGQLVTPERLAKPEAVHILIHKTPDGRSISFFGDLHPSFAGNVVKAMASATKGYPILSRVLKQQPPKTTRPLSLHNQLQATIHAVQRLTPTIVEIVVHAPAAARNFQPGQFFRLQNYETYSKKIKETILAMEGLALTGAWVDRDKGLIGLIVLEMGGSSRLCTLLKPGEPVVLMGPTGTPTHIPENKTLCLVGGGLGNAVLFSIGQAARAKGCRVLYFAGYKQEQDRYKIEQIEAAADVVVWTCDKAPGFTPTRPQDYTFVGNIVEAMQAYAVSKPPIPLSTIDHMIVIGSDRMMAAVTAARHKELAAYLNPQHMAIGSINSPMQCMMKEICAQCLQRHIDPATGEETVVFSCFNQDQPLDHVDWHCLHDRLKQNSVSEKLMDLWVKRVLNQP